MSRYDYLQSLRAERHEEQRNELLTERVSLEQQHRDASQRALDLVALGDPDSARWIDANLEEIEREVAQIDSRLDAFDRAQAPADGLYPLERAYVESNPDIAAQPGAGKVAAFYSDYMVGLGYERGTPEFIEGMKVILEPQNYERPWDANDVCAALDLSPDEYNKQVDRLWKAKAAGGYPDK